MLFRSPHGAGGGDGDGGNESLQRELHGCCIGLICIDYCSKELNELFWVIDGLRFVVLVQRKVRTNEMLLVDAPNELSWCALPVVIRAPLQE